MLDNLNPAGRKFVPLRLLLLSISVLITSYSYAEQYKVSITRKDDHIYHIDGTDYYLHMPYTYEYCYGEDIVMVLELYMGVVYGTAYFPEYDYELGMERFTQAEDISRLLIAVPLDPGAFYLDDYGNVHENGYVLVPASSVP